MLSSLRISSELNELMEKTLEKLNEDDAESTMPGLRRLCYRYFCRNVVNGKIKLTLNIAHNVD